MNNKTSPNSILVRARRNSANRFDFDNNKLLYEYEDDNIKLIFSSPKTYTIESIKFLLLWDSEEETLDAKYEQRPDLFSFDKYGTELLDWALLYVNDMLSYEDFKGTIYVPSQSAILYLTEMQLSDKKRRMLLERTT